MKKRTKSFEFFLSFPMLWLLKIMEEICLKCDYVMAGDLSGIMFNHVSDFSTVSLKS